MTVGNVMFSTVCRLAIRIVMSVIVAVDAIRFIVCTGQFSVGDWPFFHNDAFALKRKTMQRNEIHFSSIKYNIMQGNVIQ